MCRIRTKLAFSLLCSLTFSVMDEKPKLSGLVSKFQWRHQISSQNEANPFKSLKNSKSFEKLSEDLDVDFRTHQFYYRHFTMHARCKTVGDRVVRKRYSPDLYFYLTFIILMLEHWRKLLNFLVLFHLFPLDKTQS